MPTARAKAEHALRPLRATMGCALSFNQAVIHGMFLRQGVQRFGHGVEDHRQFVVEFVRGGSQHSGGAIGFGISLHARRISPPSANRAGRHPASACKRLAWRLTIARDRQTGTRPPCAYCTGMVTVPYAVLVGDVAPPIWSEIGTALPVVAVVGTITLIW